MRMPLNWRSKLFMSSLFLHRLFARKMGKDICVVNTSAHQLRSYEPREATLELASREIYRYNIEGSTAELGVYRGDFAKVINHFFPDRKLYLFDTFEGFNVDDAEVDRTKNFSEATQDFTKTSAELVLSKMEHPENCIIRKGWFPYTADGIDDKFCFVSLDADLYQPMIAGLEFFYPRLVHGGVIMLHDFNAGAYSGVRQAIEEFCTQNNIGYTCIFDTCGSAVIAK